MVVTSTYVGRLPLDDGAMHTIWEGRARNYYYYYYYHAKHRRPIDKLHSSKLGFLFFLPRWRPLHYLSTSYGLFSTNTRVRNLVI